MHEGVIIFDYTARSRRLGTYSYSGATLADFTYQILLDDTNWYTISE